MSAVGAVSFYAYAPYNALDEGEDATSTDDEYLLGTVALSSNDEKALYSKLYQIQKNRESTPGVKERIKGVFK